MERLLAEDCVQTALDGHFLGFCDNGTVSSDARPSLSPVANAHVQVPGHIQLTLPTSFLTYTYLHTRAGGW
jgi:hypothetical protein